MAAPKHSTLNTNARIPTLGFGTWQSAPNEAGASVFEALKAGYRHLDFAKVYGNQKEIGESLQKAFKEISGLKREDIFITSKLWNSQHRPQDVEGALDDCLAELQLEYLDLYLMHFPVAFDETKDPHNSLFPMVEGSKDDVAISDKVPITDTWIAMTKLPKSKARAVGVSNFTPENLQAIIDASKVVPAANQVERHPLLPQPELVEFCKKHNIHITAYSAFGNNMFNEPLLLEHEKIKSVASRLNATPAQVILAWSQVGGHSVIPKSVTPSRIRANLQEIDLSPADIEEINQIGLKPRRYNVPYIANKPRWNVNIFNDAAELEATHKVVVA